MIDRIDRDRDRDERPPAGQARLWRVVREAAPPAGAKRRVLAAIEGELGLGRERRAGRASPGRRLVIAACAAAACAAVLGLWRLRAGDRGAARPVVLSAAGARDRAGGALAPGDAIGAGAVDVAAAGHLSVRLPGSRVDVAGPGTVELIGRGVHLHAGAMEVSGQLAVEGPGCAARIDGRSQVSVRGARLEVRVFAGSAEIAAPAQTCEVIDLTAPAAPAERGERPPAADPSVRQRAGAGDAEAADASRGVDVGSAAAGGADAPAPSASDMLDPPDPDSGPAPASAPSVLSARRGGSRPADTAGAPPGRASAAGRGSAHAPRPSALSEQVDAYWAAVALRATAPADALARLRALARRWPRSAIRPEVELAIYDTLRDLGRADEARARARLILDRYPGTPRAGELGAYLREAP